MKAPRTLTLRRWFQRFTLTAVAALLLSALPAFAGSGNANGSGSGNWSQPSLWNTSPAGFFPNNGVNGENWSASMTAFDLRSYTVTLDVPVRLTALDIRNGAFVLNNSLTLGSLNITSIEYFNQDQKPDISGAGQIDVTGPMTFNSGTLGSSGVVNAFGGLTITTQGGLGTGALQGALARTLNNYGVANFSGSNHWNIYGTGIVNNLAGATWNANPGVSFRIYSGTGAAFNNLGIFNKNGGNSLRMEAPFNNSGTANINAGAYQLFNDDTHSGTYNIASGAQLTLSAGTHNFTNTAVVNAPAGGTILIDADDHTNGGTTNFAAPVSFAANTVLRGGSVNFNATTTLNTLNMNHHVLSSVYVGGHLGGTGTTTVTGQMTWYNGTIEGTGLGQTFNANGGVAIVPEVVDDTGTLGIINRTMNIGGTGTNSSLYLRTGQTFYIQGGRLNNLAGSTLTLDLQTDFQGVIAGINGPVFNNEGTLKKIGTKYLIFQPLLTNSGTVILEGGTIGITTGTYTQTAGETRLAGGALSTTTENFQGGNLTGFGAIYGAVTVTGGTIAPTGAMIASNTVSLTSASTVDFDIGGTTPGTGYDTLRIDGGGLARNGTLKVRFANGFENTITSANTFTVIAAAAATSGQFANVTAGRVLAYAADGVTVVGRFAVNAAGTNSVVLSNFVPAVDINVEQPALTTVPDGGSRAFGLVNAGASGAAVTFTVRNTGDVTNLSPLTISVDGNAADFDVSATGSSSVAPGGSTTFTVAFHPTSGGAKTAALHIANNVSGSKNPYDITLTGTGNALPTLTLPASNASPLMAEATMPGGAAVTFSATANDAEDGALTPTIAPASGSTFALGDTTVNVSATDSNGATTTGTFKVRLVDTRAPVITTTPANRDLTADGSGMAALPDFTGEIVATDAVGVTSKTQSPVAGTMVGVGPHVVTFTVRDAANNSAQSTATMTVVSSAPGEATWNGGVGPWSVAAGWTSSPAGFAPINGQSGIEWNATVGAGAVTLDVAVAARALTLTGGTIDGSTNLTLSDGLNWSSGTLAGTGATTVSGTSTISGGSTFPKALNRTVTNNGTMTYNGGINASISVGTLAGQPGGLNNNGTFNQLNGAAFDSPQVTLSAINNSATGVWNVDGAGVSQINAGIRFNNDGAVHLTNGAHFPLLGGGTHTGSFTVAAGTVLGFTNGAHTLAAGSSVTGAGDVSMEGGGAKTIRGTYNLSGETAMRRNGAATFHVDATTGTLAVSQDGRLFVDGVILTASGAFTQFTGGASGGAEETQLVNGGKIIAASMAVNAGKLTGTGTFASDVAVTTAKISPGVTAAPVGALVVTGDLSLTADSIVAIDLGGVANFDTISEAGTAPLARAGTLEVRFSNSFQNTISPTNTFTVITSNAATTGQFANVIGGRVVMADGRGSFAVNAAGTNTVVLSNYDAGRPDTSITSGPSAFSNSTSATISFTGTDDSTAPASLTFESNLDGAPFAAATSPQTLNALADGAHTFAVRAVDAVGNRDASPATLTWTVDTVAPDTTITSAPSGSVNSDSATFAFTSNEAVVTFMGSLDGGAETTLTTPATFTGLAQGAHTFSVHAVDPAGNADITPATQTWTVASAVVHAPRFITGGAVPGAGMCGIPAGATWTTFGVPAINDAGAVAFVGKWKSPVGIGAAVFVDDTMIAMTGRSTPLLGAAGFKTFGDPAIDAAGHVAFLAAVAGPGVTVLNDSVIATNAFGATEIVARKGAATAEAGAPTIKLFIAMSLVDGEVLYTVRLQAGSPAVTAANDVASFRVNSLGSTERIVRHGDLFAGFPILKDTLLFPVTGSPAQNRSHLAGRATFNVFYKGGPGAIVQSVGGALIPVVQGSDAISPALPGAKFRNFGPPATDGTHLGFVSLLRSDVGGALSSATGIYTGQPGAFEEVARVGRTTGIGATTFSKFRDPVQAPGSAGIAFPATLGHATAADDSTLWWKPDGSPRQLLAREGAQPPGVAAGAKWSSFGSLALPGGDIGPIFVGTMKVGSGGVKLANDTGLWAIDSSDTLRLLFREGDTVGGKVVGNFMALSTVPNSWGVTRSFNNHGAIVWRANFIGGSSALVVTQVP